MYLAYVQSVGTKREHRVVDLTPAKEEVFWGWFREEIEAAEYRMKMAAGHIDETGATKANGLLSVPVNVAKKKICPYETRRSSANTYQVSDGTTRPQLNLALGRFLPSQSGGGV